MNEIITQFFILVSGTAYGEWAMLVALAAFIITHVVPHLPPTWTAKIPDWVMLILNSLSGQYKNSANRDTDIRGNPR